MNKSGDVLFKVGNVELRGKLFFSDRRIALSFKYNKILLEEVKSMEGRKWHPEEKMWSVAHTPRNIWAIRYLTGQNPYKHYNQTPPDFEFSRRTSKGSLLAAYSHQCHMVSAGLTFRQMIWAAEMGTGKSLSAIEMSERSGLSEWLWVGTGSSIRSTNIEFEFWKYLLKPRVITYDSLHTLVGSGYVPQGIIFDEAHKLKSHTTRRTQSAITIASEMRIKNSNPYVILMTGTPAPKNPVDWWALCEIACPGFLKEGDPFKFSRRLGVHTEMSNSIGQIFPKLVGWKDSDRKCDICNHYEDDHIDGMSPVPSIDHHEFTPGVNEVEKLYRRMKGLVLVKLKKDCLDLPEKVYRVIRINPTQDLLRVSNMITRGAPSAVSALIKLRELSDGFQYKEEKTGQMTKCPTCEGRGKVFEYENETEERVGDMPEGQNVQFTESLLKKTEIDCFNCSGLGEVPAYARSVKTMSAPKVEVLKELLDEFEQDGRLVVFAGFQGSVDLICDAVTEKGWRWIRVDGRGWHTSLTGHPDLHKSSQLLGIFQNPDAFEDKIVFVANPGSGGVGLTLTASQAVVFYSNTFKSDDRMQAEDRIHRIGTKGATIIDIYHLPSDEHVHNNLKRKKELQDMTLGEVQAAMSSVDDSN